MMRVLCALAFAFVSFVTLPAAARVERFAMLIGNNHGNLDEMPLRYAESDALRVYEVLNQLGDFSALNMLLLRGQDATTVRSGLLSLNERIRDAVSQPDTQAVLVVYYSGHADAHALHLGGSELPLSELRQIARGSAADFRLVVLDACRSGSLTRVKGGRQVPVFDLAHVERPEMLNDGIAFLTASSAHEDAQESDELRSAFFTHAFVSGLFGAADANGDGAVVLDEVYQYAYQATLRATSRTLAGAQHPTFHYDLRGRGQLVLTRPRAHIAERSALDFPAAHGFLLMRGGADGAIVVELEREAQSRTLTLEPGRYFVRARGPDVMYEGMIDAPSGRTRRLELAELERIDYARLVRRRGSSSERVHGLEAGMSVRSALPSANAPCVGGFAGYAIDWSGLGARIRFSSCASSFANRLLRANVLASDVALQAYRAWDLHWLTFELGLGAGISVFHQSFDTTGSAPERLAIAPFISVGTGVEVNAEGGWYARVGLATETHLVRLIDHARDSATLRPAFAVRSSVGIGKRF